MTESQRRRSLSAIYPRQNKWIFKEATRLSTWVVWSLKPSQMSKVISMTPKLWLKVRQQPPRILLKTKIREACWKMPKVLSQLSLRIRSHLFLQRIKMAKLRINWSKLGPDTQKTRVNLLWEKLELQWEVVLSDPCQLCLQRKTKHVLGQTIAIFLKKASRSNRANKMRKMQEKMNHQAPKGGHGELEIQYRRSQNMSYPTLQNQNWDPKLENYPRLLRQWSLRRTFPLWNLKILGFPATELLLKTVFPDQSLGMTLGL